MALRSDRVTTKEMSRFGTPALKKKCSHMAITKTLLRPFASPRMELVLLAYLMTTLLSSVTFPPTNSSKFLESTVIRKLLPSLYLPLTKYSRLVSTARFVHGQQAKPGIKFQSESSSPVLIKPKEQSPKQN